MNTHSPLPKTTFGFVLNDVARLMRRHFDTRARSSGLGLTRAQWQVLAYLSRSEGINQARLADQLDIAPITLVGLLDRLQALGLIERRADPADRRARRLFLTDRAPALLIKMHELAGDMREASMRGLSDADQAALMRMLLLIRENLMALDGVAEEVDRAR